MHPISLARFDALAGYCRDAHAMDLVEEQSWHESDDGRLLGVVFFDRFGGAGFQGIFLARDLVERFRAFGGTDFFDTPEGAVAALVDEAPALLATLDEDRAQGDEPRRAVDFFALRAPEARLHPSFALLRTGEGYSPARELIASMMRWHQDIDGNYVQQFQTTAFDARLMELYVFALLVENQFAIRHEGAAPDYLAQNGGGEIAIEVTTVNPTFDRNGQVVPPPDPRSFADIVSFMKEYMPIKFAGPLTAKLRHRYWELPHVAGRPLVIAIQDFHAPASMTRARTGLGIYLYGYDHDAHHDAQGTLVIQPRRVTEHRWGDKVVPSDFFSQEGAEHISAVLFNTGATLSKFNRIGSIAGFGSRRLRMIRTGTALDPDPNAAVPLQFSFEVDEDYHETWSEGLDIFHNPRALQPLDPHHFPMAKHHSLLPDGQMSTLFLTDDFQPLASITTILVPDDDADRPE